jgi:heat shock protein HslJ
MEGDWHSFIYNTKSKANKDMKYLFLIVIATAAFNCSPKLSPDSGWGNQQWVVVEMKGVPVQQSGGRRDAHISFDVTTKRFSGNGGCNQINGNYILDKKEIKFTEVLSTKMSCNDIEFENTFLSTLSSVDRFEMRESDLLLKKSKEIRLVLRPK